MAILAQGQLGTVANVAIVTGNNLPNTNGTRIGLNLCNTSASLTETVLVSYTQGSNTARRLRRFVLAPNEQAQLTNIFLIPGDTFNASTTDASTVDYLVYEDSGESQSLAGVSMDSTGAVKGTPNGAAITGATTLTTTSANGLTVGRQGTTNPAFNVDASAATSVTGLNAVAAAAAAGFALSVTSSGAAENLTVDAKGSGTITLNGTGTGNVIAGANLAITDAKNIVLATTTGTTFGTATTQKLSFYGVTPVVQPVTSTDKTTGTTGASTGVSLDTTFTGASGSTAYTVGGLVTRLKALGLIAA